MKCDKCDKTYLHSHKGGKGFGKKKLVSHPVKFKKALKRSGLTLVPRSQLRKAQGEVGFKAAQILLENGKIPTSHIYSDKRKYGYKHKVVLDWGSPKASRRKKQIRTELERTYGRSAVKNYGRYNAIEVRERLK